MSIRSRIFARLRPIGIGVLAYMQARRLECEGEEPEPVPEPTLEPASEPFVLPRDSHLPTAVDCGQHDVWKRQMRLDLWRFLHGKHAAGLIDLREVGLRSPSKGAGECVDFHSALFPLKPDACAASRRLGFRRLCVATGLAHSENDPELSEFYAAHNAAARAEAERAFAVNKATAQSWPEARGPFVYDSVEVTLSILALGPFDGPEHYDVSSLPPLIALKAQE